MKKYIEPSIVDEIIELEDIIATSPGGINEGGNDEEEGHEGND